MCQSGCRHYIARQSLLLPGGNFSPYPPPFTKHYTGHKITARVLAGKYLLASPHIVPVVFVGVNVCVAATRWPGVVGVSFKHFFGVRQFCSARRPGRRNASGVGRIIGRFITDVGSRESAQGLFQRERGRGGGEGERKKLIFK